LTTRQENLTNYNSKIDFLVLIVKKRERKKERKETQKRKKKKRKGKKRKEKKRKEKKRKEKKRKEKKERKQTIIRIIHYVQGREEGSCLHVSSLSFRLLVQGIRFMSVLGKGFGFGHLLFNLVDFGHLVVLGNIDAQISQHSVLNIINPTMNSQRLTPSPGILNNGGMANVLDLLDDIQLAHFINLLLKVFYPIHLILMLDISILDASEPVINQTILLIIHGSLNTSTQVMATDNDVFYLQVINGIMEHREAVQISMIDTVGDISVDKDLTRSQFHQLISRDTAIRATNPHELWALLCGQLLKVLGVSTLLGLGPITVVLKDVGKRWIAAHG